MIADYIYPAVKQVIDGISSIQLQSQGTLAGELMMRPRCWYFRNPHFQCWLKGGDVCQARDGEHRLHAIYGGGPCVSAHPSDIAPALLALDAEVLVRAPSGARTVALSELFALPEEGRRTETTLRPDELVLSIRIPASEPGTHGAYLKAMDRKVWAFALVGAAVALRQGAGGAIEQARVALSGVAPTPWRCAAAEELLLGQRPSEELFARAAEAALAEARPLAHNGYKLPLAKALVRRALASLL